MASSSSGDGSSTSGGRSERPQYWSFVPAVVTSYRNYLALPKHIVGESSKFENKLRERGAGLDAAVALLANPKSNRLSRLHVAASTKYLEAMVVKATDADVLDESQTVADNGAYPKKANDCWTTPVQNAAKEGVLSKGANNDPIFQDGEAPLHNAFHHGHTRMVELLLLNDNTNADADVDTDSPVTPLLVTARKGLADCIKCLLNNDADPIEPDEGHVSMRNFIQSALAFMRKEEHLAVKNILMQSMIQIKDGRPRNCARVCFDGSNDEFEQSFRGGIEGIRLWCYANRKRVRLPRIYRLNLEVFTTPAKGTFYLTLEYKRRYLALSFAGRDLYFMGWRSIHGTFELKPDSQKKGYMAGDCTILNIKKNYMFLAPDGEVGKTRMGPLALQQAFEILYKCRGQVSDQLMEAVGIFAVHFSESARIQDVLNDACLSIQGYDVPTLDNRNKNSYWVENWDNLAGVAMQRANCIDKGDPPPPIENPDGAPVLTSELQIFRQIRILPRDAYKEGIFRTEQRTSPVFEDPLDDVSSGVKSGNKRSRSEQKERGKKKVPRLEDHSKGEDEGYPAYSLLDEWGDAEISWHENQKDMKQEKENSGEIDDEEVQSSEEEQFDVKGKSAKTSGPADVSMDDYLDHFNIVKNMLKVNNTKTEQLELPISSSLVQRSIYPVAREMFPSYGIMRPNLKESTSIGGQKSGLVTHLRRPQLPCLQRNLLRACTLVTRFLKFV